MNCIIFFLVQNARGQFVKWSCQIKQKKNSYKFWEEKI